MLRLALGLSIVWLGTGSAYAAEACSSGPAGLCAAQAGFAAEAEARVQPTAIGRLWGCIAAGIVADASGREYVATASATGITEQEAIDSAVTACQDMSSHPDMACKPVKTFQDGCWHIANGVRGPKVKASLEPLWADAFARCERDGYTCRTKVIGLCLN